VSPSPSLVLLTHWPSSLRPNPHTHSRNPTHAPPFPPPSPARRLFPPLLTASLWERKANIPGLVLLMEAYLSKGADTLQQHIEPILGIFSNLVAFRSSEKYAVDLLMSVFEHFPHEALAKYERRLFEILLTRLQVRTKPSGGRAGGMSGCGCGCGLK
jgi:hypothetical protein